MFMFMVYFTTKKERMAFAIVYVVMLKTPDCLLRLFMMITPSVMDTEYIYTSQSGQKKLGHTGVRDGGMISVASTLPPMNEI